VNTVIETSARRRPLNRFDFEGNAKMKTSILIAAIAACALSVPIASAQDQAAPDKPAMGMGQQMSRMQQNMTAMQAQMEQIRATSDPTERRKLLQAHMQAMQDNMKAMGGMGGPMMMGGGQPGGMAKGDGKPMAGGDMMQRHQMMENRMSMMHLMMEQMLQHQQAMESMPAK
jgi:hypothetical protein